MLFRGSRLGYWQNANISGFAFNPNYLSWNVDRSTGGVGAIITFYTDGRITGNGNIVNSIANQFLTPTSTGAASGYSVRMKNDGVLILNDAGFAAFGETPAEGSWTDWYVLTSDRVIGAFASPGSPPSSVDLNFIIEIRNNITLNTISVTGNLTKS
jgi:hypothetical protein